MIAACTESSRGAPMRETTRTWSTFAVRSEIVNAASTLWAACGSSSATQVWLRASYDASQWAPGFFSRIDAACGSAWATTIAWWRVRCAAAWAETADTSSAAAARAAALLKRPELVAKEADRRRNEDGDRGGGHLRHPARLHERAQDTQVEAERHRADGQEAHVLVVGHAV